MVEAVVGSVVSGVVGKALGGSSKSSSQTTKQTTVDPRAYFKPVTLTSGTGTVTGNTGESGAYNWDVDLAPQLNELQNYGFGSALPFYNKFQEGLFGLDPRALGYQYDPNSATNTYFNNYMSTLYPEFTQQNQQLRDKLFAKGTGGLLLGGEYVGENYGTQVNPDVYNLNLAQARAANEMYSRAREQAREEEMERFNVLNKQDASELGLIQAMLSGGQSMFGLGSLVEDIYNQKLNTALALEQARSNAYKQNTSSVTTIPQESLGDKMLGGALSSLGNAAQNWGTTVFNPATGQSTGSVLGNVLGGDIWTGSNSNYGSYYDAANDFYAPW
jgi:hypothetical protein